jgi:RNA polymerase sigma-70 factor (ECF subfamily)
VTDPARAGHSTAVTLLSPPKPMARAAPAPALAPPAAPGLVTAASQAAPGLVTAASQAAPGLVTAASQAAPASGPVTATSQAAPAPARTSQASPEAALDPHDFEAIYEAYFGLVWRNLRRLGVPEATAEDAAQDVFLAIHRRLADFEGRSSLRTWIFGFVLRVARDHRRRDARKGGAEPLPESLPDRSPGPLDRLEQSEGLRLLDDLLATLDDDRRAVFVMGEIEQMTAPEIAEALAVKLNTVYSRLRLARRDFEREIERRRGGVE